MKPKKNKGKQFESKIREAFERVPNVSIDRVHDQTTKYKGSTNICDFIVYKEPYEYYIECKSVHGNILSFSNIRENQWNGLLEKSKIEGVYAGVICWWIDKDKTLFLPIQILNQLKRTDNKSVRYDINEYIGNVIEIKGEKKRVFFDYDMEEFLNEVCN